MRLGLIIKKAGERRKAKDTRFELLNPSPEIDSIWTEEAQKRWQSYKAG
jgi:hypothetical protein